MLRDNWVVVCDFDGTVTTEDASEAILAEFADPVWRDIDEEYARGEIGLEECIGRQFALVKAPRAVLRAFVEERIVLRPHFREFAAWCRAQGLELVLLSGGLDFYIEAILEREGIADFRRVFCVATEFGPDGIRCRLPVDGRTSGGNADYKRAIVERLRAEGRRIAYLGDGLTDRQAVAVADLVFARRKLLEHCRAAGLACIPFEDFRDVQRGLAAAVGESIPCP